ncbi:MAG: hypothetical protein AAFV93_06585, partial [Chloroflexota bacterium]
MAINVRSGARINIKENTVIGDTLTATTNINPLTQIISLGLALSAGALAFYSPLLLLAIISGLMLDVAVS